MTPNAPFDFPDSMRDPTKFESSEWRDLVDNRMVSVSNMTPMQIRESIVCDILAVTMWEQQTGRALVFKRQQLSWHLMPRNRRAVERLLDHPDIVRMIQVSGEGELRISPERLTLRAAMDYAGVWYTGFYASRKITKRTNGR